jgi:hypothetical protein
MSSMELLETLSGRIGQRLNLSSGDIAIVKDELAKFFEHARHVAELTRLDYLEASTASLDENALPFPPDEINTRTAD